MLPRSPSSQPTARTPPFLRLKARCWDGSQAPTGSCQSWGVSSLSGASAAVSLKPKPLHFRLQGGDEGVDWREHLRRRLNTEFQKLSRRESRAPPSARAVHAPPGAFSRTPLPPPTPHP